MPQPKVSFTFGDGALGRTATGEDHISGLIVYANASTAALPGNGSKVYYSLKEAETDGIISSHANANVQHLWLQIRDFFRMNPSGVLYTHFTQDPVGTQAFAEIATLQTLAGGKIRQFGIHVMDTLTTTLVNALQTALDGIKAVYTPAVAVIGFGGYAVTGSLLDMTTLTAKEVGVVLGQLDDSEAFIGDGLVVDLSANIATVGLVLGALSSANVGHSIGYVRGFDYTKNRTEGEFIKLANSDVVANLSASVLDTVHDKGYLFFKTYVGVPGVYLNLDKTATSAASDYSSLRNNRTVHKALRGIYANLVREINAPVTLNADGTLTADYVGYLETLAEAALVAMQAAGEISGYSVDVDPAQDVLGTSTVAVSARILPLGCSSYLTVSLGYTVSIA